MPPVVSKIPRSPLLKMELLKMLLPEPVSTTTPNWELNAMTLPWSAVLPIAFFELAIVMPLP